VSDDYGPTQLGVLLLLAGVATVGTVVGAIGVGALVVAGARAVARALS
jgi:F0F1-type ATP synthase membrane subunit c/vacuolar-type H+-ATPase subunit K